jgi:DinB superfamily
VKTTRQLDRLEPFIINPTRGVSGDAWYEAPRGKWSLAQIVSHLAIGIDSVAGAFEHRAGKTGMTRRATPGQAVLRHLLLGFGKFPPGQKAPEPTRPAERPDAQATVAQFRIGVERTRAMLEQWPLERQNEIFVKHPYLGDLNLREWVRFHYVHCRHHARQVQTRLKWLARR